MAATEQDPNAVDGQISDNSDLQQAENSEDAKVLSLDSWTSEKQGWKEPCHNAEMTLMSIPRFHKAKRRAHY